MTDAEGEYFGDALQRITTSQKALPIIKPDFRRAVAPVDLSVVLSHSKPNQGAISVVPPGAVLRPDLFLRNARGHFRRPEDEHPRH